MELVCVFAYACVQIHPELYILNLSNARVIWKTGTIKWMRRLYGKYENYFLSPIHSWVGVFILLFDTLYTSALQERRCLLLLKCEKRLIILSLFHSLWCSKMRICFRSRANKNLEIGIECLQIFSAKLQVFLLLSKFLTQKALFEIAICRVEWAYFAERIEKILLL